MSFTQILDQDLEQGKLMAAVNAFTTFSIFSFYYSKLPDIHVQCRY